METVLRVAPQASDVTILTVVGDKVDPERGLHRLQGVLERLIDTDSRYLVVDLSGLGAIEFHVLAEFMWAVIMLRAYGGNMAFAAASEPVAATLVQLGVDRMVKYYDTVDDAVVALRGSPPP
ncbi:MAG: STAS domain-containing protein [candidate division WS1 bacterium]|jgi:anti-anti-sigma regulatory factor|nr:STAS domain-containing protein [candidate division WS1 bacterium]